MSIVSVIISANEKRSFLSKQGIIKKKSLKVKDRRLFYKRLIIDINIYRTYTHYDILTINGKERLIKLVNDSVYVFILLFGNQRFV